MSSGTLGRKAALTDIAFVDADGISFGVNQTSNAMHVFAFTDVSQMRIDYGTRTDGQPLYIGYAASGVATSTASWILQKFTYTTIGTTDYVSLRQIATDSWDLRTSASYS